MAIKGQKSVFPMNAFLISGYNSELPERNLKKGGNNACTLNSIS
jgi:hypothetical protein